MKVAIVYYSGTGNTEQMAYSVMEGATEAGAEVSLFSVGEISVNEALGYDSLILGCPAMGAETLEEDQMEPFMSELEAGLGGKKVGLFGSYGWGDGEWMRNWEERILNCGGVLVTESVICNDAPDDEALEACNNLGKELSK